MDKNDSSIQVKVPADDRDVEFSFPATVKKNGEEVEGVTSYKILRMSVDELKTLCKNLRLQSTGKKAILQDRLKEYSKRPDMWNAIKPGARRSLRGPRNSATTKTQLKGSQKRRLALLAANTEVEREAGHAPRTLQHRQDLLEWATQYVKDHPEIQEPRVKTAPLAPKASASHQRSLSEKLDGISKTLTDLVNNKSEVSPLHPTPAVPPTASGLSPPTPSSTPPPTPSLPPPLSSLTPSYSATVPNSTAAPDTPIVVSTHPTMQPLNFPSPRTTTPPTSSPPQTTVATTTSDHTNDPLKHLTLAGGVVVEYRLSEVPDPRRLAFTSGEIERLVHQWSDDHPKFDSAACEVVINGYGVALKYWPEVFGNKPRGSPDKRWTSLKGRHNEWKFVALEYQSYDNPDDFWAKYRDDKRPDSRMTFSQISTKLRDARGKRRKA